MQEIIYVGGTFDLFHIGHLELLREAAKFGKVVVALNSDAFVERYKGKKPIMSLYERAELVGSCKFVHSVIENIGNEDSTKTIENLESGSGGNLKVIAIVHGDDWIGDALYKQMGITHEWLHKKMISMIYVPRTTGISTTKIKERNETRDSYNHIPQ